MTTRPNWGDIEERWGILMEVLRSEPDDTICQTHLNQLNEYVMEQLAGKDYMARFPGLAMHLDSCPDCADAYARVYELELAEAAGRLPQPEHLPDPDLSFLLPQTTGALSPTALRDRLRTIALTERLQAALRRVGDWFIFQLSAELLPLLRPSPAVAPIRSPSDTTRYGEVLLTLDASEGLYPDLPVTLTVYRDNYHPETCLVEMVVEPPGRSWPELEGIGVTMIVTGERRKAISDAWGLVAFEDVSIIELANVTFEIVL